MICGSSALARPAHFVRPSLQSLPCVLHLIKGEGNDIEGSNSTQNAMEILQKHARIRAACIVSGFHVFLEFHVATAAPLPTHRTSSTTKRGLKRCHYLVEALDQVSLRPSVLKSSHISSRTC